MWFRNIELKPLVETAQKIESPPKPKSNLSKIPTPPTDAATGKKHQGVQIGLWTEKLVYKRDEIRNVWTLARNDSNTGTTIGPGGSLYKNSFLYITSKGEQVAKLPLSGGVDGMVNPITIRGGISSMISKLPKGSYKLVWRTESLTSNAISIDLK